MENINNDFILLLNTLLFIKNKKKYDLNKYNTIQDINKEIIKIISNTSPPAPAPSAVSSSPAVAPIKDEDDEEEEDI
jgi:hypothetical protein